MRERTRSTFVMTAAAVALCFACGGSGSAANARGIDDGGGNGSAQDGLSIEINPSVDGALTNGNPFELAARVTGGEPDQVSFSIDGVVVATVPGDSPSSASDGTYWYSYPWKAGPTAADGDHLAQVDAVKGSQTVVSAQRMFVLDRTPPQLVSVEPSADAGSICLTDTLTFHFSEAIEHGPDSGVIVMCGSSPCPVHYDPLVRFALDDGGVVDANTILEGSSIIATLKGPDGGSPEGGYGGHLVAGETDLFWDLAHNGVAPFSVGWQVDAGCVQPP